MLITDPALLSSVGRTLRFGQAWSTDVALFAATWFAMTVWSLASGFLE